MTTQFSSALLGRFVNLLGPDIVVLLLFAVVAFTAWMLIDCLLFEPGAGAKIGYSVMIIFFPLIGSLAYCFIVRAGRRRKAAST